MIMLCYLCCDHAVITTFPLPNYVLSRECVVLSFRSLEHQKIMFSYVVIMSSFPLPNYVLSRECVVLLLTSAEHHNDNVMLSML